MNLEIDPKHELDTYLTHKLIKTTYQEPLFNLFYHIYAIYST